MKDPGSGLLGAMFTGLFHLLNGASRSPVEFQVRGDDTLLILGRYVYHREK
ncbi:MAG: hypothetical protein VYE73_18145 [Acidobacteriota bacterium]|nr:hypothetical protein [Acidobacteriota bacterium]